MSIQNILVQVSGRISQAWENTMVYTCIYCILCIYPTTRSNKIHIIHGWHGMYLVKYVMVVSAISFCRQMMTTHDKNESGVHFSTQHMWTSRMVDLNGEYSGMAAKRRFHPLKIPNKPGPPPLRGCAMCGSRSSRQPWRSRNFENRHRAILHGVSWLYLQHPNGKGTKFIKVSYHFKRKCLAVQEPWWV